MSQCRDPCDLIRIPVERWLYDLTSNLHHRLITAPDYDHDYDPDGSKARAWLSGRLRQQEPTLTADQINAAIDEFYHWWDSQFVNG